MPNSLIQFLTSTGGLVALLAAIAAAGALISWIKRAPWRLRHRRAADVTGVEPALRALLREIESAADQAASRAEAQVRRLHEATRDAEAALERVQVHGARAASVQVDAEQPPAGAPERAPNDAPSIRIAATTDIDPRCARIHELADAGRSPIDIAASTGMMLGEVELVLNLRRFR